MVGSLVVFLVHWRLFGLLVWFAGTGSIEMEESLLVVLKCLSSWQATSHTDRQFVEKQSELVAIL